MWSSRHGKECTVHEYRPEGRIVGVVVQTAAGSVPKVGGKVLPGRWPGQVGAAKKALIKESKMAASKNSLAVRERIAMLKKQQAEIELELATIQRPAPTRHVKNAACQNTSNWRKNQHVSGRGYVRYVDDNTYAAFVDGGRIVLAAGRNPTAARNAAKKAVTRELTARGAQWEPRVFS